MIIFTRDPLGHLYATKASSGPLQIEDLDQLEPFPERAIKMLRGLEHSQCVEKLREREQALASLEKRWWVGGGGS